MTDIPTIKMTAAEINDLDLYPDRKTLGEDQDICAYMNPSEQMILVNDPKYPEGAVIECDEAPPEEEAPKNAPFVIGQVHILNDRLFEVKKIKPREITLRLITSRSKLQRIASMKP